MKAVVPTRMRRPALAAAAVGCAAPVLTPAPAWPVALGPAAAYAPSACATFERTSETW